MTLSGVGPQLAAPRRGCLATDPRARAKHASLLKNKAVRRLACSCLNFESYWPEQFSESRILQPAQPTWM
jgi:hypothetical protein